MCELIYTERPLGITGAALEGKLKSVSVSRGLGIGSGCRKCCNACIGTHVIF